MIIDNSSALKREFESMFKEIKIGSNPSQFVISADDKETLLLAMQQLFQGAKAVYDTAERSFRKDS